jgi:hypothetical protein
MFGNEMVTEWTRQVSRRSAAPVGEPVNAQAVIDAEFTHASAVVSRYGVTSTPRQKATYPLILRAAGLGSG